MDFTAIYDKHGINPHHRCEITDLVLHGTRPSRNVLARLDCVDSYAQAYQEALALKAIAPEPPAHYESLGI